MYRLTLRIYEIVNCWRFIEIILSSIFITKNEVRIGTKVVNPLDEDNIKLLIYTEFVSKTVVCIRDVTEFGLVQNFPTMNCR